MSKCPIASTLKRAKEASNYLKGLSHEIRLAAICSIGTGEKTVQELAECLETTQSNLSQHLSKLREKGILDTRKSGNQVYYRVKDDKVLELIKVLSVCDCK